MTITHEHTCNTVFPTVGKGSRCTQRTHVCFSKAAGRESRAPSLRLREAARGRTAAARGLKWLPLPPREASRPERIRRLLAEERSQRLSSRPKHHRPHGLSENKKAQQKTVGLAKRQGTLKVALKIKSTAVFTSATAASTNFTR